MWLTLKNNQSLNHCSILGYHTSEYVFMEYTLSIAELKDFIEAFPAQILGNPASLVSKVKACGFQIWESAIKPQQLYGVNILLNMTTWNVS